MDINDKRYTVRAEVIEEGENWANCVSILEQSSTDSIARAEDIADEMTRIYANDKYAAATLFDFYHVPEKYRGYSNCIEHDMRGRNWYVQIEIWDNDDDEAVYSYASEAYEPDYVYEG